MPAFESWRARVAAFARSLETRELRLQHVRVEEKNGIVAFHWRGARDEEAARMWLDGVASEAEAAGLGTHWGRKVLEIRPPVEFDKGAVVGELVRRAGLRVALFGGDDATDLDAFDALEALVERGELDRALCVGVGSDEGPRAIVERADLVVEGVAGFAEVLAALARP